MDFDSKELEAYVKSVITAVDNSKHRDMVLKSDIEFELSVLTSKEAEGGIKILIANAGGKYEKEAVSKIKFSIGYKLPASHVGGPITKSKTNGYAHKT